MSHQIQSPPTRAAPTGAAGRGAARPRCVLIAGASGLLGRALVALLRSHGHRVLQLVRRATKEDGEVSWNPAEGRLDPRALEGVEAIVNLSGENVAGGRWTEARRRAILRSRVDATKTLILAIQQMPRKPEVLVNASAVGYYGDRGDVSLDEAAAIGHGFLPEVCLAWETHAEGAARAGVRTVLMRFGVVLSPAGGALAKMLPVFRCGLGGALGGGRQWMSWVACDDAVGAVCHAILEPRCRGPLNVVAPEPVTNAGFTTTLASVLRRPAILPVPGLALRAIFGAMADETLLASTRAVPRRLMETGYRFRFPNLESALRHELAAP